MTAPIQLSKFQPNTAFVQNGDIRTTDSHDGIMANAFGLNRLRGNFVQRSVSALQNAIGFLKTVTMPLLLITKPIENVFRAIKSAFTKETRQAIFPAFKNALQLTPDEKEAYGREANICSATSNNWGSAIYVDKKSSFLALRGVLRLRRTRTPRCSNSCLRTSRRT